LQRFLLHYLAVWPGTLALLLAACHEPVEPVADREQMCASDLAPITIVTRIEPGRGVYLEDPGSPGLASRALFVADNVLSDIAEPGQQLRVSGRVEELGSGRDTLTSLVEPVEHVLCADAAELPVTRVQLPLDAREREALEGMRLAFGAPLSLSDHYDMFLGEWTLSSGSPLRLPTEDAAPGDPARALAQLNRERAIRIVLPGPDFPALAVGASVRHVVGVLGQHDNDQRLLLEATPRTASSDFPDINPPASGSLRMISLNLLNFFNGDGRGGGFPTARGAVNPDDFRSQQERTAAAITRLQPHLMAVQELENDGFGPDSAAQSLLDVLNGTGSSDWAFINPGVEKVGGDIITVALFYRQQLLEPLGPAAMLNGPAFDGLSRVPVAQLFRERLSGESFLVAVNHLKSKGRCPSDGPDADQGDGQGCWNPARVRAVNALLPWLDELAKRFSTRQILILGDMNAWRREDPIAAYRKGGYVELVEELSGLPQHSFLYFGQRGTLDYALASPELASRAHQAVIWHINADWPRNMSLPQPWLRMSDHDPVVLDFVFSHAVTSD